MKCVSDTAPPPIIFELTHVGTSRMHRETDIFINSFKTTRDTARLKLSSQIYSLSFYVTYQFADKITLIGTPHILTDRTSLARPSLVIAFIALKKL